MVPTFKALCLVALHFCSSVTSTALNLVTLPHISSQPSNASQVLDPALASFSIEFSYLPSFGGNLSNPNLLTQELVQRIIERTGVAPDVRPGGISVDSSIFDPNGPAMVLDESASGGIFRTTIGPAYYESLAVFGEGAKITVDVDLHNMSIAIAQGELQAAIEILGWDRIRALELGNEADHYGGSFTSTVYTQTFLNWTATLSKALGLPQHIFQAGGFAEDPTSAAPMTTVSIINEGVDTTGVVKLFSQHTYQYSTCDPTRNAIATLPHLINHGNITAYLDLWRPQIAAAKSVGKDFVVGEYNSVSCSGKENVTDTFGQALWVADTVLYGAFLNISRLYLHQGATLVFQSSQQANGPGFSWYDLWYPIPSDRYGSARASPSYVSYLLIAEAVGSSQQSRLSLINIPNQPEIAAYAIWDPASRTNGIARLAILNLGVRNVSTSVTDAASVAATFDLSPYMRSKTSGVQVKRMAAPGLDSKDSSKVTWAGQRFENGVAEGNLSVEQSKNGMVTVQGSEGVLVFF